MASLTWSAVSGAVGYHVYRDGIRITAAPVSGTSYTDGGLSPATTYGYAVGAVDADGVEGTRSVTVPATTTGPRRYASRPATTSTPLMAGPTCSWS